MWVCCLSQRVKEQHLDFRFSTGISFVVFVFVFFTVRYTDKKKCCFSFHKVCKVNSFCSFTLVQHVGGICRQTNEQRGTILGWQKQRWCNTKHAVGTEPVICILTQTHMHVHLNRHIVLMLRLKLKGCNL